MDLVVENKLKFLFDIQRILQDWGLTSAQANAVNIAVGVLMILILAWLSDVVTRKVVIMLITRMVAKTKTIWDDILLEKKVFDKLSHLAPALVLWYSVGHVLSGFPVIMKVTHKMLSLYMLIVTISAINAFMKGLLEIYETLPASKGRSIKGYIQLVQIIVYSIAIIVGISIITGTPTQKLITGLGAATAVLMFVFKDTILGLVAGIQLSGNDMLRIGDWITMTKYGADGHVIEITLNTIKVRNFDKTIVTIPTYVLVSDSFINWRGTEDEGSRRFRKYLNINMKSIQYCDPEMIKRLSALPSIRDFMNHQESKKIRKGDEALMLHEHEFTNLTLFRKYIVGLLKNHNQINQKLPMMVRQLQSTEYGMPLEITAFCKGTDGLAFEELQSDLFDHLMAVAPEFGLNIFQYPS
jgi:miniconductance mechanosensitive channel